MNVSFRSRSMIRAALAVVVIAAANAAYATTSGSVSEPVVVGSEGPTATGDFDFAPGSGVLVGPSSAKSFSSIGIPSMSIPSMSIPSMSIPSMSIPSISVPSISVPTVNIPAVNIPSSNVPAGNVPSGNVPSVPPTVPSGMPASAPYVLGFQGMDVGWGVQIASLNNGGMAVKMGLEPGDVIVQVNGQRVLSLAGYRAIMAGSGGWVRLVVRDVRTGTLYELPAVFLGPTGAVASL